jgi:hypothetical protein
MRLFNLFLRRAGVQSVPARANSAVSRLTIECPRNILPGLRKHIYSDFEAAGLQIAALRVDHAGSREMARACVTIRYLPEARRTLMSQARQLGSFPGVQRVHWGKPGQHALN